MHTQIFRGGHRVIVISGNQIAVTIKWKVY